MSDPIYLGENELGIPVYGIKEGEMRPLVDKDGKIRCAWCDKTRVPMRYILKLDEVKGIDWAVLFCPKCTMAHCIMKVRLETRNVNNIPGMKADMPKIVHPDPHHEVDATPFIIEGTPDG